MVQFNDIITLITGLLPSNSQITAANHRTVETAILTFAKEQWLPGDLKMIDCTNEYISANFETSGPTQGRGLPGGERDGWAICNGLNGTMNRTGRVPLAWGNLPAFDQNGWDIRQPYIKLNGQGVWAGNNGEAITIAQMPTHSHDIMIRADSSGGGNYLTLADTSNSDEGGFNTYPGGDSTTSNVTIKNKGGGNAHNNLQPYLVTLFIQKI